MNQILGVFYHDDFILFQHGQQGVLQEETGNAHWQFTPAYNLENGWAVLITVYRSDSQRWVDWRERRMPE